MYSAEQDQEIVELYKAGYILREIAQKALGVRSIEHVLTVLNQHPESGYFPGRRRTRRSIYQFDESFFETIDTEAKAYYLGLFAADGWIKYIDRQIASAVCYELVVDDRILLDTLHNIMGPLSPPVKLRQMKPNWTNAGKDKVRLVFHSAQMARDLVWKGFGKDKTYHLKGELSFIPALLRHHLVRGYIDGDGGPVIGKYRLRFQIRGTRKFLESLQAIIPAETKLGTSSKWPTLRTDKHGEAVKIYEWLYQDATIYLPRKRDKCISGLRR